MYVLPLIFETNGSYFCIQNKYLELLTSTHLSTLTQEIYCYYVEIKCQLDATDDIYCRFYCLLNMFRGTIIPIMRSSRVL